MFPLQVGICYILPFNQMIKRINWHNRNIVPIGAILRAVNYSWYSPTWEYIMILWHWNINHTGAISRVVYEKPELSILITKVLIDIVLKFSLNNYSLSCILLVKK